MSLQEDPDNNTLHLFIPKCRICKQKMIRWDIRGIIKQDEVGVRPTGPSTGTANFEETINSSSIAPTVTHMSLVYRCMKHDDWFKASPEMLQKMNSYPSNKIVYHHVEF